MTTSMVRQTMFANGEVDVITWKRTDNADAYMSAAQSMLNAETGTTGLAKKRRGTISLFDVTNVDPQIDNSTLYEFIDQNGVPYIILAYNLAFNIYQIQDDGSVIFYQTVVTPYARNELFFIDYTLDNDVLILTHPVHPVARLYITTYTPSATFAYQVISISPLPSFDFNDVNYNAYTVSVSGTGAVGTSITITFSGTFGGSAAQAWIGGQIVAAGTNVNSPLGYMIISSVVDGGVTAAFTGTVRIAMNSPFSTNGDQYSVRKPAFLAGADTFNRGYPSKCLFYQNRLWLANTPLLPTTVFSSKINAPSNFDIGVGSDTDGISYTIGLTNAGEILWLNGGKQLEMYTTNYELVCPQDQAVGLTAGSFSIRQQSSYGSSSFIKPITYINDSYYVTRSENSIINFHFEGVGLAYSSNNVSALSTHLVFKPVSRAIQKGTAISQDNLLYFLNSNVSMTSFQFSNESKLAALSPIKFQFDEEGFPLVDVIDIVTVNNEIYLLKKLLLTQGVFIEKFTDDFKIDSYIQGVMDSTGLVTGLGQFEGYTVQVIFDNQDYGEYLVTGGQIIVNNPNHYSGTVYVGLLYPLEIRPMYLFAGANATYNFKQITNIFVDYYNSLDFYVNGTLVNFQNFIEIQNSIPLAPQTGTAIMRPVNGWDRFQTFNITQNSPFDCQILSISYQIDAHII